MVMENQETAMEKSLRSYVAVTLIHLTPPRMGNFKGLRVAVLVFIEKT